MVATNRKVAETLIFMGQMLEIQGEDTFKIRAYYRAADQIERMNVPVSSLNLDELMEIPGIGKAIAKKIEDIIHTGTFQELEDLRSEIPESLPELLKLNGIGPKTIHKLWKILNIESVEELEKAARNHRIRAVRGFKERKEAEILQSIAFYRQKAGRITRNVAEAVVARVSSVMQEGRFTVAGSYRRGKSTVGDIDIVSTEPPSILNSRLRSIAEDVIEEGERRTSVRVLGQRVDIRFSDRRQFGTMLLYLTGSKEFNIRLREIAIKRGLKVNEYGIQERETGTLHEFDAEEEIFQFLGMAYIPPELREDRGEIERAITHTIPELVARGDIVSDLHVHSIWSDGHLTLAEIMAAGNAQGYEYLLVSDHSASLGVAHGLDAEGIADQKREIDRLNQNGACQLLQGIEVDILADGTLGLKKSVLADLDVVIGAVHSGFKQDRDTMTRRILSAIENEHVDIIGHPTGRLLTERPSVELDMGRVIEMARETGTALEINASPYRMDLDDIYIRQAREEGVKFSIGTDAHSVPELENMRYGVTLAQRGWCERGDLLNTMKARDLLGWIG